MGGGGINKSLAYSQAVKRTMRFQCAKVTMLAWNSWTGVSWLAGEGGGWGGGGGGGGEKENREIES